MKTPSIGGAGSRLPRLDLHIPSTAGAGIVIIATVILSPNQEKYTIWSGAIPNWDSFVWWLLSSWTEPVFYTSALAGAGLLIGALFATYLKAIKSRWQGFGLACGSGLWPWTVTSSALGLVLSNIVWGWTLHDTGVWQPTFVAVASIAPATVLAYGGGWRSALRGAVLSAVLVTPLCIAATHLICRPLGLPLVVGVTGGMTVGALLSFAVCRFLFLLPPPPTKHEEAKTEQNPTEDLGSLGWTLRRTLADFSEAQFFGNEWASIGLILGALLAYFTAPGVPVYGSGLLPILLTAQCVTALVAMALWHRKWVQVGFYPTFVPIVSVVPAAVLAFDGAIIPVFASAILGALVGPPLAAAIATRLPEGFHPFIGNVASMTMSTAIIIPILSLLFHTS